MTTFLLVDLSGSTNAHRNEIASAITALQEAAGDDLVIRGYSDQEDHFSMRWEDDVDTFLHARGAGTPTAEAMVMCGAHMGDEVIVFTDGASNTKYPVAGAATRLAEQGVRTHGVVWSPQDYLEWSRAAAVRDFGEALLGAVDSPRKAAEIVAKHLGIHLKPQLDQSRPAAAAATSDPDHTL